MFGACILLAFIDAILDLSAHFGAVLDFRAVHCPHGHFGVLVAAELWRQRD